MSDQIKCPRCGYQKDMKAMLKHFNRKNPCPVKPDAGGKDVDINTVKDSILKEHIENSAKIAEKTIEIEEIVEEIEKPIEKVVKPNKRKTVISKKPMRKIDSNSENSSKTISPVIVVKSDFNKKIQSDEDSELCTDSDSELDTDGESVTYSDVKSETKSVPDVSDKESVKSIDSESPISEPEKKTKAKKPKKRKTKAQMKLEEKQKKEFLDKRKEIRAKEVAKRKVKEDFVKAVEEELAKEPIVTPDENSPEGIAIDMRSMIRFMHRRLQLIEQAFVSSQLEIKELRETNSIITQNILMIMSIISGNPDFIKNLPISKDIFPQHVTSMEEVDQDPMIKMRQDLKNFPPKNVLPKKGQTGFQNKSSYKYATVNVNENDSDDE
jgi:hypothetical protein